MRTVISENNIIIPATLRYRVSPDLVRDLRRHASVYQAYNDQGDAPACIGAIFSQGWLKSSSEMAIPTERLEIYPNYCQIQHDPLAGDPKKRYVLDVDSGKYHVNSVSKRGRVRGFSAKSRNRMIRFFGRMAEPATHWQDLTFHDSVMAGLTLTQRAEFSYECLRRLTVWIKRKYPLCWAVWRREYEPRKSGTLRGELVPHFHVMFGGGIVSPLILAAKWVEITGVRGADRISALSVACNHRSWRRVQNARHAIAYVTKYVSKTAYYDISEGESIGRQWGRFGAALPLAEPEIVDVTLGAAVILRRMLRRKCKSASKMFRRRLSWVGYGTFCFGSANFFRGLAVWAEEEYMAKLVSGLEGG